MLRDYPIVGADMVTMTLPLPRDMEPDWEVAAHAIRGVRLAALSDTDYLFDWENWLWDTPNLPSAVAAFTALRAAEGELHQHACMLRGAIEHGWAEELIELETPAHRVWVTGGPSWGEDPCDLVGPVIKLAEAGITEAAGFEGYTRYDGPPISERKLGFAADDVRLTLFGQSVAHAAEQARALDHPARDATAIEWLHAWMRDLDAVQAGGDSGRALMRFAARGLALTAWLKYPAEALREEGSRSALASWLCRRRGRPV